MKYNRRNFLKSGTALGMLAVAPKTNPFKTKHLSSQIIKAASTPVLKTEYFKQPVKIASIELLKNGQHFLVRAKSKDGTVGMAVANPRIINSTYPILLNRVIPFFIGKDARDLENLIEGVYLHKSNYKWQGLAFWVCVAWVEFVLLDLLGKVSGKPVGDLLGGVIRRDISIYRASSHRGNSPEEEVDYLAKLIEETGAKAVKFRLGGRMMYNEKTTRRDKGLIPLARKKLGDEAIIYVDANGSYDIPMAIEIGRILEDYNVAFFEEPCPFDYYEETKQVANNLTIPIAGGEEESSLRQFRWMIENDVLQLVQPDLVYFGGFIRSIRVARMAAAVEMDCTPHMSGHGLGYLYVLHFASCVPNVGLHQEYKGDNDQLPISSDSSSLKSEQGRIRVPSGPGFGITLDRVFINNAEIVSI